MSLLVGVPIAFTASDNPRGKEIRGQVAFPSAFLSIQMGFNRTQKLCFRSSNIAIPICLVTQYAVILLVPAGMGLQAVGSSRITNIPRQIHRLPFSGLSSCPFIDRLSLVLNHARVTAESLTTPIRVSTVINSFSEFSSVLRT